MKHFETDTRHCQTGSVISSRNVVCKQLSKRTFVLNNSFVLDAASWGSRRIMAQTKSKLRITTLITFTSLPPPNTSCPTLAERTQGGGGQKAVSSPITHFTGCQDTKEVHAKFFPHTLRMTRPSNSPSLTSSPESNFQSAGCQWQPTSAVSQTKKSTGFLPQLQVDTPTHSQNKITWW